MGKKLLLIYILLFNEVNHFLNDNNIIQIVLCTLKLYINK
jgi:hypothetical protein